MRHLPLMLIFLLAGCAPAIWMGGADYSYEKICSDNCTIKIKVHTTRVLEGGIRFSISEDGTAVMETLGKVSGGPNSVVLLTEEAGKLIRTGLPSVP